MTDELKPCPFCGAKEPEVEWSCWSDGDYRHQGWVICGNCGAEMRSCWKKTMEAAIIEVIEEWNRRTKE